MSYEDAPEGWFPVRHKGWRQQCCECQLVHVIKFRVKRHGTRNSIEIKVTRDERATAAVRRGKK